MKTYLCNAVAALAGTAGTVGVCLAQQTLLEMQVSKDGVNWSNSVSVDRSTGDSGRVLIRAMVTWVHNGTTVVPLGLASLTFQPVIANPRFGVDVIAPFAASGNNTNGGSVELDATPMDGPFGRIRPFAATGPASTAAPSTGNMYAVIQHSGGVGGGGAPPGNYYRIARNNITNWMGVGATTTTAAVNNFNGSGGIACVQKSSGQVSTSDPLFFRAVENFEVFRFAIDTGAAPWEMQVLAPVEGMSRNTSNGHREASWFASGSDHFGSLKGEMVVTTSTIFIVPGPGVLGVLAPMGLFAACWRKRHAIRAG